MNWEIKIISKTLMTKISHISWGGYDKGFYGTSFLKYKSFPFLRNNLQNEDDNPSSQNIYSLSPYFTSSLLFLKLER